MYASIKPYLVLPSFIGDAVPAMFLGCLAFLIPMELPKWGKQHGKPLKETLFNQKHVNIHFNTVSNTLDIFILHVF